MLYTHLHARWLPFICKVLSQGANTITFCFRKIKDTDHTHLKTPTADTERTLMQFISCGNCLKYNTCWDKEFRSQRNHTQANKVCAILGCIKRTNVNRAMRFVTIYAGYDVKINSHANAGLISFHCKVNDSNP